MKHLINNFGQQKILQVYFRFVSVYALTDLSILTSMQYMIIKYDIEIESLLTEIFVLDAIVISGQD